MAGQIFHKQVQEVHSRLTELYHKASTLVELPNDSLLPVAFKELGTTAEELQVMLEELQEKTQQLEALRHSTETQQQRYQELLEFLPDACLVTDANGKILEANSAAAKLFNLESEFLLNKLIIHFIPLPARSTFRSKLTQLFQYNWIQEWETRLQPHQYQAIDVKMSVAPVSQLEDGQLRHYRWLVRDITESKQALKTFTSQPYNFCENRPKHLYTKGEIIPLQPQTLWLVCKGLVKLNTMNEKGDEVLTGLVNPSMPFGSGLTALPTYQATALSETVEVVSISASEIATCPHLNQVLLPKISERLRQTEFLLAISGKRHVKDRLYYLLQWLKKEVGQPIERGTRLTVRLTHQDLADACCTTRVTITRLLGKLQEQGKILVDTKNHICFIDHQHRKCG
jgi:PAS domain S-box-containing protein